MKFRVLIAIPLLSLLAGCAGPSGPDRVETRREPLAGQVVVVEEFSLDGAVIKFNAPHDAFGLMVAEQIASELRRHGHQAEAVPAGGAHEADVVVTGRILRIDAGSRSLRYWVGFGAGAAKFGVAGQVAKADGSQIGAFSHERWSGFGVFGGNSVSLVQKCLRAVGSDIANMVDTGIYTRTSG